METRKRKFDYKWIVLIACFLMNFVCLGFTSGRALYLTAITEALQIERSVFSLNETFRCITLAVINLFFGGLLYHFGAKKMITVGFAALIASMVLSACADNVIVFYIAGVLLGIGLAFTTTTITGSIIRRWFKKNVGRYTGIVLAANGIGSAVVTQIISPLINDPVDPFGYRRAYVFIAVVIAIVGVLVVAVLRERPNDERIESVDTTKRKNTAWTGITFQEARRRPYFYLAAAFSLLTGFVLQGVGNVYAAHMRDLGVDAGTVATVASISGLTLTFSKVLMGVIYDRFGLRAIMLTCHISSVFALVLLVVMNATPVGMIFAVVFAVAHALSLPLETLAIPLIVNDLFGTVAFDKILGLFAALNYIGYAASAPITNLCFDLTGSYKPAFLIFCGLMVMICIIFQFIITAARKEKVRQTI